MLLIGTWGCYPILWLFCDGARAVPPEAFISVHTCLDILSQCIFGLMLVRSVKLIVTYYGVVLLRLLNLTLLLHYSGAECQGDANELF
jgi:bacteriorhodopsin